MKTINFFAGVLSALVLMSCGNGNADKKEVKLEEKIDAVAIYNKVGVRAEAMKKAKYLTNISYGEKIVYLGEEKVDSSDNNRKYLKVELSDGTKGWAYAYGLITKAKPACIVKTTPVYSRPDLINQTDKELFAMEFVAVKEVKDDWVSVIGENKKVKGWVKKESVSNSVEDITTSILAKKGNVVRKGVVDFDKVASFIEKAPYQESQLIKNLKLELEKKQQLLVEEEKEDTEDEELIDENEVVE